MKIRSQYSIDKTTLDKINLASYEETIERNLLWGVVGEMKKLNLIEKHSFVGVDPIGVNSYTHMEYHGVEVHVFSKEQFEKIINCVRALQSYTSETILTNTLIDLLNDKEVKE